ncbi:MAG: hypothetical protein CVV27_12265 [Candidatus Melainabacteria bacterium HGW-Melainabacteria-1]|nr:MAG: hypothetical protein CVV27_12265 [Candidatus Melainabacteria bacterium HGW-Melainabacteria-1]
MSVVIPDDVLQAAQLTEDELRQELAVLLFQQARLTLAQASRLAKMGRLGFQRLLASRGLPLHNELTDLSADVAVLQSLGRL